MTASVSFKLLEDDRTAVEATFLRIKADTQHRAAVMLSMRETPGREFGSWDMACERIRAGSDGRTVSDTVDALVSGLPRCEHQRLVQQLRSA